MKAETAALWDRQDRHRGDRLRLFSAVAERIEPARVLYPGSFVDVAPSFVWDSVTYSDIDRRAAAFFDDAEGVREIVARHRPDPEAAGVAFLRADHAALDLPEEGFDLLISLYAGPVSEHCTRFLRIGGHLLVNPSHGDAALAAGDRRYRPAAAILAGSGRYRVAAEAPDRYLVAKRPVPDRAELIRTMRGVPYTRRAFAFLFERVA